MRYFLRMHKATNYRKRSPSLHAQRSSLKRSNPSRTERRRAYRDIHHGVVVG